MNFWRPLKNIHASTTTTTQAQTSITTTTVTTTSTTTKTSTTTEAPTSTTTNPPINPISCFTCTNCGFNNIGNLITFPSNDCSCFVSQ